MDTFDYQPPLKKAKRLLVFTASWPKSSPSLSYRIRGYITLMLMAVYTVALVAFIFDRFEDTPGCIYALCLLLATSHGVVKQCVLSLNRERFFRLLAQLQQPVFTDHGSLNAVVTAKMKTITFGRFFLLYSVLATVGLMIFSPIFELPRRSLPGPCPLDMEKQSVWVYGLVWLLQAVATVDCALVIAAYDGMIIFLVGIAAAQLKILREKIMRCHEGSTDDQMVNTRLKQCVIHHIAIERYIVSIEEMFMISFLIQMLVSLIVTVFCLFNCVITPVDSPNFGRSLFFFVAVITELSLFCVPGNEIILQSGKIRDACYLSEWANHGPAVRRSLQIMMERSKRPLKLTAGKFVSLSLDTLFNVLKSSFSYFTVLRQMYSKAEV